MNMKQPTKPQPAPANKADKNQPQKPQQTPNKGPSKAPGK